jgi:hypothetical protein
MSTEPQREIISTEYERSTYNGISIIRHIKTGYINATKICSDNNKRFQNLTDSALYPKYARNRPGRKTARVSIKLFS